MPRLNVTNVTSSGTLQSVDTFCSTDGFRLPSYSTAQRPTGIPDGTMIWNTTASAIEIASGPDKRTTAMAPIPGGVANAAMV